MNLRNMFITALHSPNPVLMGVLFLMIVVMTAAAFGLVLALLS